LTQKKDVIVQDLVKNLEKIPQNRMDSQINLQIYNKTKNQHFAQKKKGWEYIDPSEDSTLAQVSNYTKNGRFNQSSYILARRETLDTLQNAGNMTMNTCEDAFPTFSEYDDTVSKSSKNGCAKQSHTIKEFDKSNKENQLTRNNMSKVNDTTM
jgi:hypothetical protein